MQRFFRIPVLHNNDPLLVFVPYDCSCSCLLLINDPPTPEDESLLVLENSFTNSYFLVTPVLEILLCRCKKPSYIELTLLLFLLNH